ncbi:LOW QUALITY PROTEIN: hypothetical protein Cgig2_000185 [Carnegiea gigantea]|uniref:Reverse transcriptase zinc-binding domain-containing protein n=1 Tax=Carnegiea gigantea TaxID=171969 RepID=A0A9Q1QKC3_9CARY|nr:LOW QUALITY PROTEIN: hypothetical protein Cgig2_000185 [Carnegiea gigantea]
MSDHLPILLKCTLYAATRGEQARRFHFENMWFIEPSCEEVVMSAWTSAFTTDVVKNLLVHINRCSAELSKWNYKTFGHVGTKIWKLEAQLHSQHDAPSRRRILGQIKEWRKKEEILWWQQARSDYLTYEDANTRWFHSRISRGKARSSISGLWDSEDLHLAIYLREWETIICCSRWLIGDGISLNVWEDRWLPRPFLFKPVTPRPESAAIAQVSDLIDRANGCWHETLVRQTFLPCDADIILDVSLCDTWPRDRLIWHYNSHGIFIVRSAYHLLLGDAHLNGGGSSFNCKELWKAIWGCSIPPRIKLFGWRACKGILHSALNISMRLPNFSMACSVCSHPEESDVHVILECPLANSIWEGVCFDMDLTATSFRTLLDCIDCARTRLDDDRFGEFLAVMWECCNVRNRFIFKNPDKNLYVLESNRFCSPLLHSSRANIARKLEPPPYRLVTTHAGCLKLNFDGGRIGDSFRGWGFVLRNQDDDVLLTGAKHGRYPASAAVEEARSCLHGLHCAYDFGARNIIVEGDYLAIIQALQARTTRDNIIGLFVCSILSFIEKFDFYAWSFVKREGNRVAHDLAHWQPLCLEGKLWESDAPESVLTRASDDMYGFLTSNLI